MEKINLLILLMVLTFKTHGFTLNNSAGAAFENDEVKINVADQTCTDIGMTNDALLSIAVEGANKFWNRVPTSRLKLVRGGIVSVGSIYRTGTVCTGSTDSCTPNPALNVANDILIVCNTNATNYSSSPSVVGVTVPNNISGDKINGAIILVNDTGGSSNAFRNKSRKEQEAIMAHEIGHAVGLGHSPLNAALMYFQSVETRESLGRDDIDGITWLYPIEQPDLGCSSVAYVPNSNNNDGSRNLFLGFFLVLLFTTILKFRSKFRF